MPGAQTAAATVLETRELVFRDVTTRKVTRRMKLESEPLGIVFSRNGKTAFVSALKTDVVLKIDLEALQIVVIAKDPRPISRLVIRRDAVAGRNRRLKVLFRQLSALGGNGHMVQSAIDHHPVPLRTILIFQTQQPALLIHARRNPRCHLVT